MHRVPDIAARVLFGPDTGHAARVEGPRTIQKLAIAAVARVVRVFACVVAAPQAELVAGFVIEYATVARRLETFFRPSNYTNVRGLVLIGY